MAKYEYAFMSWNLLTNQEERSAIPELRRPEQTWEVQIKIKLPGETKPVLQEGEDSLAVLNRLGEDGWDVISTTVMDSTTVTEMNGWPSTTGPVTISYLLRREKP